MYFPSSRRLAYTLPPTYLISVGYQSALLQQLLVGLSGMYHVE